MDELPREEALVRLYQLRDQIEITDSLWFLDLPDSGRGYCDDCHADTILRAYGDALNLCERCALGRLAVRRRIARENRLA